MAGTPLLQTLLITWGVITAVFIILMIWRSMVAYGEEDILFLDPVEDKQATEQKKVVTRVVVLTRYAKITGILSAILLLAVFGVWIYRGIATF